MGNIDENRNESLSISIDLYLLDVFLELIETFNSKWLIQLRSWDIIVLYEFSKCLKREKLGQGRLEWKFLPKLFPI